LVAPPLVGEFKYFSSEDFFSGPITFRGVVWSFYCQAEGMKSPQAFNFLSERMVSPLSLFYFSLISSFKVIFLCVPSSRALKIPPCLPFSAAYFSSSRVGYPGADIVQPFFQCSFLVWFGFWQCISILSFFLQKVFNTIPHRPPSPTSHRASPFPPPFPVFFSQADPESGICLGIFGCGLPCRPL